MSGASPSADLLACLAEEFLARHRRGERPALTEYQSRHPELAERIGDLFPALVLLEDVRPGSQTVPCRKDRQGDAAAPRQLGEYRIVREIGRGGMGVVYEAEQESLGRRVALKVLPPGALADARQVERFQREARAAARLHHTNIVPVFGVGEDNGTHYYVMQYIEGRPLDQVLAELCRLRASGKPDAGAPAPAGAPSSVDVGRSLAEGFLRKPSPEAAPPASGTAAPLDAALGSGHVLSDPRRSYAKSVAFIGVQIADALEYAAKQGVLHRDVKPSNLLLDVWGNVWLTDFGLAKAAGTPNLTRTGDLVGTLRYLAPERLQGRADVRGDVYALGLTLYEALALRPAFDDAGQVGLFEQIAAADPPRLDSLDGQLPHDLVTVVHKAMARDSADRYQTPRVLADDLRRFLDDRPILARHVGPVERAWRWCRRNPTGATLMAAVLALVALAIGSGFWMQRQEADRREEAARREGRTREAVAAALQQADALRLQGRWLEAKAVLLQAETRLDDPGPDDLRQDLRQQLQRARAALDVVIRLEGIRLKRASMVDGTIDYGAAAGEYAAAFAEAGFAVEGDLEALAARLRDSPVRAQLVAALEDWAIATRDLAGRARLMFLARRADPEPKWRDRFRDPATWEDRQGLAELARQAPVAELSPQLLTLLGMVLRLKAVDASPLLRAAQKLHPEDFWINFELANTLLLQKKAAAAVAFYRAALALRPNAGAVHNNLGNALAGSGRPDEAIEHYRKALHLDRKYAPAHNNLANVLRDKGRLDEAIAEYREALALNPGYAHAHNNLGIALVARGRLDEAIGPLQEAVKLDPHFAQAHNNLGNALRARGRLDEAIAHFNKAIRLDPGQAAAHCNLGNALFDKKLLDRAVAEFEEALRLDPKLAQAHSGLGDALATKGLLDRAIAEYRDALRLRPDYAEVHCTLGIALRDKGRLDEAIDHLQEALRLDPTMAPAHTFLGIALAAAGQLDEAIVHFQLSLLIDPEWAPTHYSYGNALNRTGRLDEAIREFREAVRLRPDYAEAHCNLGLGLKSRGHFAAALESLKRGHELGSKKPGWTYPSAQWVKQAERFVAVDHRLSAVLTGKDKPAHVGEMLDFAQVCRITRRYAAAARFYADAFAAVPRLADELRAGHRYNAACAAALAGLGADATLLDDQERARWRRQALDWLRADLTAWARTTDPALVQKKLRHWQQDSDLAGVRDQAALAKLPRTERAAWSQLWSEVAERLPQLDGPK
jgi:tetratricopeptide (TPR) repeat protein